ncbi:MAG: BrnT family toxin [Pseudomonadales bacterium]|nr:BrnT family toxin [Pseudomonadales bacterium]
MTANVYCDNIHNMIDFRKIAGFDWDKGNSRKSHEKHNVSQAEAEQAFFNDPLLLLLDGKHGNKEARYHAYGKTDKDRKLHIAFTLRESSTLIRVISARGMHRKERVTYDKA